ncbi:hypothetical protein ACFY40_11500 [Streptomyces sp. NPDC012950]|uniref:hypothetical protein n=1 Tax=Streptomyces sp. NPDC012950 TaxID=3364858 RepID=UPI003674F867
MTGPSSTPRGEHTPRPGTTWKTTTVGWKGEQYVEDDAPDSRPNRATRQALARGAALPEPENRPMTIDEAIEHWNEYDAQRDREKDGEADT